MGLGVADIPLPPHLTLHYAPIYSTFLTLFGHPSYQLVSHLLVYYLLKLLKKIDIFLIFWYPNRRPCPPKFPIYQQRKNHSRKFQSFMQISTLNWNSRWSIIWQTFKKIRNSNKLFNVNEPLPYRLSHIASGIKVLQASINKWQTVNVTRFSPRRTTPTVYYCTLYIVRIFKANAGSHPKRTMLY